MTNPALASLRERLGPDLAVLDELSPDEAAELLELIAAARDTQQAALDEAVEAALGHLPKLVRGTARRILFG